jgi:cytochrome b6-f complex iron-sulfur subunit
MNSEDKTGRNNSTPSKPEPEDPSRRSWLARVMWGTLVLPVGVGAASVFRYLYPLTRTRYRTLYLCRLDDIPLGQQKVFLDQYGREFVVTRTVSGLRAFSTRCTHLGCKVLWRPDRKVFHCPCHEGYFDHNGKVIKGPPPRPLETIPITEKAGNVYIRVKEA